MKQEVTDFFHIFQKGSEGKSFTTAKILQPVSPQYYFCNTSQLQPPATGRLFNYFLVWIGQTEALGHDPYHQGCCLIPAAPTLSWYWLKSKGLQEPLWHSEDHNLFFSLSPGPLLLLLSTLLFLPGPVFCFSFPHFFQLLLPPAFFIL